MSNSDNTSIHNPPKQEGTISGAVINGFAITIDMFDGPIDLLLHLVQRRELPIDKISLRLVAEQYLQCISDANIYDFELAGEYLVVASTLLAIKSKSFFDEKEEIPDSDALDNVDDPEEELLRRMRELEKYKMVADALTLRDVLDIDVFPRKVVTEKFVNDTESNKPLEPKLAKHNPNRLSKVFAKILAKYSAEIPTYSILVDPISIKERMTSIVELLSDIPEVKSGGIITFEYLVDKMVGFGTSEHQLSGTLAERAKKMGKISSKRPSNVVLERVGVVVSVLLAVLELCKTGQIKLVQDNIEDEVSVGLSELVDSPIKNIAV